MNRILRHCFGICAAMTLAFSLLQASLGFVTSQYISKEETLLTRIGGWISSAMLWPFGWIPVGVLPEGPSAFIIVYVFWGLLFYAAWLFWKHRHL